MLCSEINSCNARTHVAGIGSPNLPLNSTEQRILKKKKYQPTLRQEEASGSKGRILGLKKKLLFFTFQKYPTRFLCVGDRNGLTIEGLLKWNSQFVTQNK